MALIPKPNNLLKRCPAETLFRISRNRRRWNQAAGDWFQRSRTTQGSARWWLMAASWMEHGFCRRRRLSLWARTRFHMLRLEPKKKGGGGRAVVRGVL